MRRHLRRRPWHLLEQHQEEPIGLPWAPNRIHLEVDRSGPAVHLDPHRFPARGTALFARLAHGRAQLRKEALACHLHQIEAGGAGGRLQIRAGVTAELQHLHLVADQHPRRRIFGLDDAIGLLEGIEFGFDPAAELFVGRDRRSRRSLRQGHVETRPSRRFLSLVDLALLVQQVEMTGIVADSLRCSQHQQAVRLERVVEHEQDPALHDRPQVDQQVATTDQVQPGKGRILDQVVLGEDAQIAHRPADLILSALHPHKKALEAVRRYVQRDVLRIPARARPLDGRLADVRAEDLDRHGEAPGAEKLEQAYGDRVGLLARGAPWNPDADGRLRRAIVDDRREDDRFQRLEGAAVAQETRHVDQDVVIESLHFTGVVAQMTDVDLRLLDLVQDHPTLDATPDGRVFVMSEIGAEGAA